MPGEPESGDIAIVKSFAGGAVAAAADGIGHGPEAVLAARVAADVVEGSAGDPVERVFERSHEALKRTRGVVMSLASFRAADDTVTWVGVGNVEGTLFREGDDGSRSSESVVQFGGILGYRLPPLHPETLPVRPGDTLVLATDGVRSSAARSPDLSGSPRDVAARILERDGKGTDDALVLVVRYLGRSQ
jgi:hypothetical protein